MTSASALVDTIVLSLFQNIREGFETGRIADVKTAQIEVEAAIDQLNRTQLLEGPTHINDLAGKLILEIGSLHEQVAKCEFQLAEFQSRAEALKEETTQIVARTEACNLLVEQQQMENVKILAAMEGGKASISTASPICLAPEAPSHTDSMSRPALSRMAIVSFPGGPRTVTIHPPDSPSYQPIICDEKGNIIITLKGTRPLRREGAFRGPLEDIDWCRITRVYGRGPELRGPRAVPPMPRWPDRSRPSSVPPPLRSTNDIIARQRQLSTSMQTDAFGRILTPDYLINAKSPSLPTGMSSSSVSSQDLQSSASAKPGVVTTPTSTPPSPSVGKGKKRARQGEEDEGVPSTTETHEGAPLLLDVRTVQEPATPTSAKRNASHPPEGPAKRRKLRSSASLEALSAGSLVRSDSALDPTRTV